MGVSETVSSSPRLLQTILRHMESLRRSIEGDELYGLIARVLRRHSRSGPVGTVCFSELYHQLEVYAGDPVALATTRIKAKLLQQHILPYLPEKEFPLAESVPHRIEFESASDVLFHNTPPARTDTEMAVATDNNPAAVGTLHERPAGGNDRYDMLRRSEQDAWRAIYDATKDFSALKKLWANRLDSLAQERDVLERRLAETEQNLKSVETNREELRTELQTRHTPARKPARRMTKLTRNNGPRLMTRDQFTLQMQAEISRVKRSGGSAVLALLGIEDLQAIQQQYGDGAETAVLDCYTREILSNFRAYDIIGRFGDTAFAVLFPDTLQDGAVRALEKARKRATETQVHREGQRFPLPRFYGALTVYSPGEESASWLQRAEEWLTQARQQDRERFVVA